VDVPQVDLLYDQTGNTYVWSTPVPTDVEENTISSSATIPAEASAYITETINADKSITLTLDYGAMSITDVGVKTVTLNLWDTEHVAGDQVFQINFNIDLIESPCSGVLTAVSPLPGT